MFSIPTVASSNPATIPHRAVISVAHDVAVARCNGYPENGATCAPHPGAVTDRAHLICVVSGPTSPINRPRGILVLHCAIPPSLSLYSPSTHRAPREELPPPPPHAVTGADTGHPVPPSTGDHAPPPEPTPVSPFAPKSHIATVALHPIRECSRACSSGRTL